MRWIIYMALMSTRLAFADCLIVGETFEESPWGKADKFTKVDKKMTENGRDTLYVITRTNNPEYQVLVAVSARTKLIYQYNSSGHFESVHEAVSFASSVCRGEVFLPDRAVRGEFPLRNIPGEEHEGKKFEVSIQIHPRLSHITLNMKCDDYR